MTGDQVIARLFFEMTRVMHKTYMPDTRFGTFLDLVPVGYAIFLGQAEGRPMGLTGLARFLDIPRSSVQRRIDLLIEGGIVERRALKYEFASSALTGPAGGWCSSQDR
jgi:DNA-binding MarR family transcriptional regulator